jgi:nucleotide-binding universal stress UspA family protein
MHFALCARPAGKAVHRNTTKGEAGWLRIDLLPTLSRKGKTMAIKKILLAYNFTPLDHKAVEFAINAFSHLEDVEITIFNAYTPVPVIETVDTSITGKLKSSMGYLTQQVVQRETELNDVKKQLMLGGFGESRIKTEYTARKKDIASEIIELTRTNSYDVIVLNRKHARVTRFFSGSVSHKVVMTLKDTAVCIIS